MLLHYIVITEVRRSLIIEDGQESCYRIKAFYFKVLVIYFKSCISITKENTQIANSD